MDLTLLQSSPPILALVAGLLGAYPVRAEIQTTVRSEQIASTGADFAVGRLETGASARTSRPVP